MNKYEVTMKFDIIKAPVKTVYCSFKANGQLLDIKLFEANVIYVKKIILSCLINL